MAQVLTVFRGSTIKGSGTLRTLDPVDNTKMNTYAIPGGAVLKMRFAGESGTPVDLISTSSPQVVVVDAAAGTFTFEMSATNSALLKVGEKQAIDMHVTDGAVITIFEKVKVLTVADPING